MRGAGRTLARTFAHGSQAASLLLGGLVLSVALVVLIVSRDVSQIADWALRVLGWGYLALLAALVFLALFSLVRMTDREATANQRAFWYEAGLQGANGVTTLALTFTLLGISLGIGSLADRTLTPETIQSVIRDLTAHFSLAFMTTVVGLPISAVLRGALVLAWRKQAETGGMPS